MDARMQLINGLSEEEQSRVLKMLQLRLAREFAAANRRMDIVAAQNRRREYRSRDGIGQVVLEMDQAAYLAFCAQGWDPRDKFDRKYMRNHVPESQVRCGGTKTQIGYRAPALSDANSWPFRASTARFSKSYGVIDGAKH